MKKTHTGENFRRLSFFTSLVNFKTNIICLITMFLLSGQSNIMALETLNGNGLLNNNSEILNKNYFVDANVQNSALLISNVVNLNKDTYHLFSHGRSGQLFIEGKWLNEQEIVAYLKRQNISTKNLNIYGCEFAKGEKGKHAIAYIEKETGFQIAASTNITGKDGDWVLEHGRSKSVVNVPLYKYNLQVANSNPNEDFDGDNVINDDDVDKDNDGILDVLECNPTRINDFNNWDNPTDSWVVRPNGELIYSIEDNNPGTPITFEQDGLTGLNTIALEFELRGTNFNDMPESQDTGDLFLLINGTEYLLFENTADSASSFPIQGNLTASNGASITPNTFQVVSGDDGFTRYVVEIPWDGTTDVAEFEWRIVTGGDDYTIRALDYRNVVKQHLCGDLDGDGILNSLDLDSDGDGCPDAVEGEGSFTAANNDLSTDSSIAGGGTGVQENLGTSSDADGTPSVGSQSLGDAHAFGNDTICCRDAGNYDAISDKDNDNIGDGCDLDDDNDGILDTVECVVNLGESNFNNWDNPTSNWTLPSSGAFIRNNVDDVVSPITFTQDGFTGLTQLEFTFSVRGSNKNNSPTTTSFNDLFFTINGVDYIEFENTTDSATAFPIPGNINISNGAQISPTTFEVNTTGFNEYTVVIPWDATEDEAVIEFRQGPGGDDDFVVNDFSFSRETLFHFCTDTDNDTVANHLDTDSDDDGCPDAVEGAGDFTSDQLTTLTGGSPTANSSSDNFGTTVSSDTATLGVPTQNAATPAVAVSLPQGTTSTVLDNADATACNADLSLVKIVDKSIVKINDKIIYTLTVKNSGPNSTTDVEITDALPTGLTYLPSGSGTDVPTGTTYNTTPNVWVIGDMALNETKVLKLEATVNGAGTFVNNARVSKSSETDTDSDPTNNN